MSIHSSRESGLIEASARSLIRASRFASLATLDAETGYPYASLIAVATETDGSPLFLVSKLARHTRNLEADPRISLLFKTNSDPADPLDSPRVSLTGRAGTADAPHARARFLARHTESALYVDFADFAFWKLNLEGAHYVGGFGRIADLPGHALVLSPERAASWEDAIGNYLEELNNREAGLINRIGERFAPDSPAHWRIVACDPDGCDLVNETRSVYVRFPDPLSSPHALTDTLRAII